VGCLLWFAPVIAAVVVMLLLFPVSPISATLAGTAAWMLVALRLWGGGGSTGDDRYNGAGGPFDVD
jgi:hypothetical protein